MAECLALCSAMPAHVDLTHSPSCACTSFWLRPSRIFPSMRLHRRRLPWRPAIRGGVALRRWPRTRFAASWAAGGGVGAAGACSCVGSGSGRRRCRLPAAPFFQQLFATHALLGSWGVHPTSPATACASRASSYPRWPAWWTVEAPPSTTLVLDRPSHASRRLVSVATAIHHRRPTSCNG